MFRAGMIGRSVCTGVAGRMGCRHLPMPPEVFRPLQPNSTRHLLAWDNGTCMAAYAAGSSAATSIID
jgi:hypothetical protein